MRKLITFAMMVASLVLATALPAKAEFNWTGYGQAPYARDGGLQTEGARVASGDGEFLTVAGYSKLAGFITSDAARNAYAGLGMNVSTYDRIIRFAFENCEPIHVGRPAGDNFAFEMAMAHQSNHDRWVDYGAWKVAIGQGIMRSGARHKAMIYADGTKTDVVQRFDAHFTVVMIVGQSGKGLSVGFPAKCLNVCYRVWPGAVFIREKIVERKVEVEKQVEVPVYRDRYHYEKEFVEVEKRVEVPVVVEKRVPVAVYHPVATSIDQRAFGVRLPEVTVEKRANIGRILLPLATSYLSAARTSISVAGSRASAGAKSSSESNSNSSVGDITNQNQNNVSVNNTQGQGQSQGGGN